jgi:predicted AAA+ superfamily ATPase
VDGMQRLMMKKLVEMNLYRDSPFYWKSGNKAEVDFILQDDADIVPIEVKAERAAHAHSITEYCKKYEPRKSFVTSMEVKAGTISLYMMWKIKDYIRE